MSVEAAAKNALWFLKKDTDIIKNSQTDGLKAASAGVSAFGFANKAATELNNILPDTNLKAVNSSIFKSVKNAGAICGELTDACMYFNSIINVANADDKPKAFVEEAVSLTAMTAMEQGFKKANISGLIEKIPIPNKYAIIKPILAATAYVATSLAGSTLGRELGKKITGCDEKPEATNSEAKDNNVQITDDNEKTKNDIVKA